MNSLNLDKQMRMIFLSVQPETILKATAQLMELGFDPRASFTMLENVLKARAKAQV